MYTRHIFQKIPGMVEDSLESSKEGTFVARDCLAGAELSPKTEAVTHKCACFPTFLFKHSFGRKYQNIPSNQGRVVCMCRGREET